MSKLVKKDKIVTDYWECERCKISSETPDRMCPCPRSSCEAKLTGQKTVITIIEKFDHE